MTSPGWRTALVLGGAGSGRSDYAATLLSGTDGPRRVQAAAGDDLAALAQLLRQADPDESVLVDGLDGFLPGSARGVRTAPADQAAAVAGAVRDSPARVVIVSPDAGGTAGAGAAAARQAAEAVGELNRVVAEAADAVVLVVAGQPMWLKGTARDAGRAVPATAEVAAAPPVPDLEALPQPHAAAGKTAATRLAGSGLGALAAAVSFAAAAQGSVTPRPWESLRLFVLSGDHRGAAAAGAGTAGATAAPAGPTAAPGDGTGRLALLAEHAGTWPQLVECAAAAPIEDGPAASGDTVEQALARGYALAGRAVDEGVDVLAIGSVGPGADTAAAAVATLLGGSTAEPAGLLGRVRAPDGTFDDAAWIRRCAAVRDAVRRVRRGGDGVTRGRLPARTVLAELGGADLATATGLILGAAARRTPVLLDGPVGAAAALAARSLATPAAQWCLLVDHGGHPAAVHASEQLRMAPLLDLRLELGEGAAVLATMPLLRLATVLAATPHAQTPNAQTPPATTPPGAAALSGSTSARTEA